VAGISATDLQGKEAMSMNMHDKNTAVRLGNEPLRDGWIQSLDRARQQRDHLEMARLLLAAAQGAMIDSVRDDDEESLEHAQWLLARTQRSVGVSEGDPEGIPVLADLLEAMARLLGLWTLRDRPEAARLAMEQVRDTAFDLARRVERSPDLGVLCTMLLRAADVLEQVGDASDAQALRSRAFRRLGSAINRVDIPLLA
jgi:hypothetical protein